MSDNGTKTEPQSPRNVQIIIAIIGFLGIVGAAFVTAVSPAIQHIFTKDVSKSKTISGPDSSVLSLKRQLAKDSVLIEDLRSQSQNHKQKKSLTRQAFQISGLWHMDDHSPESRVCIMQVGSAIGVQLFSPGYEQFGVGNLAAGSNKMEVRLKRKDPGGCIAFIRQTWTILSEVKIQVKDSVEQDGQCGQLNKNLGIWFITKIQAKDCGQ